MISPLVSIVVCTHNRAAVLGEALDSLVKQNFSRSACEIIVVDNASTDETREIVGRFSRVRCVCEPCLGLSPARNRGVQAAQGEIVAFIDDDAIADPGWVKVLCSVYDRFPEVSVVGGKILPLWPPEGAPNWYGPEFAATFSALDYGDQAQLIRYPRILYGTNMSFRRHVLQAVGGFRVELGRKGKGLMANEEAELMWRIERAGGKCYYAPDAVVFHRVPPERLWMGYLLRRAWGYGVSTVVTEQFIAPVSRTALLRRGLRNLMWETPTTLLRWLSGWLPWRGGQSYRIRHLLILLDDLGRAGQALQLTCKPGKIRE